MVLTSAVVRGVRDAPTPLVGIPAPGHSAIPGRWYYSINERQTNENVPPPEDQPARNDNEPQACRR
jgi:hypothetical protein